MKEPRKSWPGDAPPRDGRLWEGAGQGPGAQPCWDLTSDGGRVVQPGPRSIGGGL